MTEKNNIPKTNGPIPRRILRRAAHVLSDKKNLDKLLDKTRDIKGAAKELKDRFSDVLRLLKAWKKGEYRNVSYSTLILSSAALLYFITPLDFIPDFIPLTGFIDDSVVLAYVLSRIHKDIQEFKAWEASNY